MIEGDGLRRWIWPLAAGLAVLACLLALALCARSGLAGSPPLSPGQRSALLDHLIAARDSYARPAETIPEAAARLRTPEAALAFVREEVRLARYEGRYLEPQEVLDLRVANVDDRAVLLAALLRAQGHEVRLRTADRNHQALAYGRPELDVTPELAALLDHLGMDGLPIEAFPTRAADAIETVRAEMDAMEQLVRGLGHRLDQDFRRPFTDAPRRFVEVRERDAGWRTLDVTNADPSIPFLRPRDWTPDPVGLLSVRLIQTDRFGRDRVLVDWRGSLANSLHLSFQPAAGLGAYMAGDPEGARAGLTLWTPILHAGPETVVGDGFSITGPAPAPGDGPPGQAPRLEALWVTDIDASVFPEMRASLDVDAPRGAVFSAGHFDLRDGGAPRMVRIESQPVQGGPVIVVLDVSGSMEEEGRLDAARAIASALVRRLGADREIGLVLFAGEPFTASEPGGEDDRAAVLEALAAIDRTYENTDLARAVDHALALGGAGARLVVLSDGAVNDAGRITAALGDARAALSAIAVRIAPEPYAEIADLSLRADTGEDAAPLADELAAAVGGPMRIAWTAPRDARPGQVRPVSVSVPDRRVVADSEYAAPDDPVEAPASTVRLALALETPDGVRRSTRTLARLTPQTAQFSLQARHRIIANLAEPDPGHVLRRYLDLMIDLVRARDAVRAGAGFTSVPDTGPDYVALALGGQLRTLPRQALAGVELQTRHPLLALHSVTPAGSQGALVLEERLDVLDDGEWGRFWGDASRQSDAGAALAAAEAVALNQTPIATRMLAAGDAVLTRGTVSSAAAAGFQIQVNSYGAVRAGLSDPPGKGMRAARVAAQFADLQDRFEMAGHVASGLGAMTGAPGGPIGAFVSLQSENLKAWCYASVTLGFLNEEIAGEATGTDDWTGHAAAQCRYSEDGLAMTYLTSMGQGFALGTLGDVLTPVVAGPVGPIASGPVVDGVVNTDLSYVITEMHGALMDRLQED